MLSPTVVRLLTDAQLPMRLRNPKPLPQPHIRLPKHRHNLFCTVSLPQLEGPFRPKAVWILPQHPDQLAEKGS